MREVRLSDGFAEGVLEVDLGQRPIHDLCANMAYGREVHSTLQEALRVIQKQDVVLVFGSTQRTLKFLFWMDRQQEFSREWYCGQIYWKYMAIMAAAVEASEADTPFTDALVTLAIEMMNLGALCREYELSSQHKAAVLGRAKQLHGLNSAEASAQRAEAREQRRAEAEHWKSVAREVATQSRVGGAALAKEVRRELKRRGIETSPSDRSIRGAVRGVKRSHK